MKDETVVLISKCGVNVKEGVLFDFKGFWKGNRVTQVLVDTGVAYKIFEETRGYVLFLAVKGYQGKRIDTKLICYNVL